MSLSFSVISSNHFQAGTTSTSMPLQSRIASSLFVIRIHLESWIKLLSFTKALVSRSLVSMLSSTCRLTVQKHKTKETGIHKIVFRRGFFINKFSCIILNCKNQIGIYHVANIIDYSLFSQGGTGAFNYISESAKGEWFGNCFSGRFFCV